ncbi:MAG TPA: hypothetical protein VFV66_37890 [Nonomuraea sp.]|nr:hypothetical protein [Nonomuraea sp.]
MMALEKDFEEASRQWGLVEETGQIACYRGSPASCIVIDPSVPFVEPQVRTDAHDEALSNATRDINSILRRAVEERADSKHATYLGIVITHKGPMLAWVQHVADPAESNQALGL